jgi:hypothetical protein
MNTITAFLKQQGYHVLEKSVHDKNQTRFYHCIVEKDGERYFCKANKSSTVYGEHMNSEIAAYFKKSPAKISFMEPVRIESYRDHVIHFFSYIDQLPVSNEAKDFRDFSVKEADLDTFFGRVIAAIRFVSEQRVITVNEYIREKPPRENVFALVKNLPPATPYGLELLGLMAKEGEILRSYELALEDIQPQNMFWFEDTKELALFDLEALSPRLKHYDYARFAVNLWCIYDKPQYAKRFLDLVFANASEAERSEKYRYIRYNLAENLLEHYAWHKDPQTRRRIKAMTQWFRRDFLRFVNEVRRQNL